MHLPEFVLLVIATLATLAAGLAVLASNFRVARILFWIAALSFGSLGVLWSATSQGYALPTQLAVSAIIGAVAAAGLTWVLWEIKGKENVERSDATAPQPVVLQPAAPPGPQKSTGIYLGPNADNNKFNIRTGIFGFEVGVESHGRNNTIDAPTVSKDAMPPGYRPPPATIPPIIDQSLVGIPNSELKAKVTVLVEKLNTIQQQHNQRFSLGTATATSFRAEYDRFKAEFDVVRQEARAVRNEMLRRLDQPLTWEIKIATDLVEEGTPLAGPSPVSELANNLTMLVAHLPSDAPSR